MSLETWKAQFYPIPANKVPVDEAVAHSLQKWIGLRHRNMKYHNVGLIGKTVYGLVDTIDGIIGGIVRINDSSCALCHQYNSDDEVDDGDESCRNCPLMKNLGRPCDEADEADESPWLSWVRHKNPEPMIQALIETLAAQKETHDEN